MVTSASVFNASPATGTFQTRYSGTRNASTELDGGVFFLEDYSRPNAIITKDFANTTNYFVLNDITDNDNSWTSAEYTGSNLDIALDVHWGLQAAYDYLFNTYGIIGPENAVSPPRNNLNASVRFGASGAGGANDRDAAGWSELFDTFYFGSGGTEFKAPVDFNIVAHEYSHFISWCNMTSWRTGINVGDYDEGIADVFAVLLANRIKPVNVWKIGQGIPHSFDCVRDISYPSNPNARDKIADTYNSTYFNAAWDPHIRGGIFSRWAYLLANGGSGTNGVSNTYSVYGVGMDQLENLVIESVFNGYLEYTDSWDDIRLATINAANTLCGGYGFLSQQVANAWYAVGVGAAPGQVQITGPSLLCTSGTYTLENPPVGASVTWSVTTPGGVTPLSGSGNVANLTMVNPEDVAITFNISGCSGRSFSKQIWVGPPQFSHFMVDWIPTSNATMCTNNSVSIIAAPTDPSALYTWSSSSASGSIINSTSPNTYFYAYAPDCYYLNLEILNACGSNNQTLTVCANNCFYRYTIFPNPASAFLYIEFEGVDDAAYLPEEICLFSEKSTIPLETINVREVHMKKSFVDGNRVAIKVENYPRGTYYVHVKNAKRKDKELDIVRIILN